MPTVVRLAAVVILAAAGIVLVNVLDSSDEAIELQPDPGPVPPNARWLSPSGSDSSRGTREQPWRSLERALESMTAGETLVLTPGTYGVRGETIALEQGGTESAPLTIRGEPGEPRPRMLGAVRITAGNIRLDHLLFDGPTGPVQPRSGENPRGEQVQIALLGEGTAIANISITDCEVRGSDWHAGVFLNDVEDARIVGNHIHHNGDPRDPGQANLSHGIYWDSGSGLVANNVIETNVARGVQLYPEPSGVVVTHNTIVGNGRAGVQVGDEASNNLILNNIVVANGDRGIRSSSLSGGGNLAQGNLAWDNAAEIEELGTGLVVTDLIAEPPLFADAAYRLERDSPAVDRAIEQGAVRVDRDGRRRPLGEAADVGAYESW